MSHHGYLGVEGMTVLSEMMKQGMFVNVVEISLIDNRLGGPGMIRFCEGYEVTVE